jgi:hypothetical protein
MATYNTVIKKRNEANNEWDSILPITTVENVLINEEGDTVATHLADYVLQIPYAVATGLANVYSVTLNPAPAAYIDGMAVAFKINVQNTGASTININGLGAKAIKKSNGNDVSSGNLKAGSIYSLRYNATVGNFILQGEGGEYGTAGAGQVLAGYTVGTDIGLVNGSMPNNGAVAITPAIVNQVIAAGYHNGSGYVAGDTDLIADNIKNGVNIFGVTGTLVPKGQAIYNTPGTYTFTVPTGITRVITVITSATGGAGGGAGGGGWTPRSCCGDRIRDGGYGGNGFAGGVTSFGSYASITASGIGNGGGYGSGASASAYGGIGYNNGSYGQTYNGAGGAGGAIGGGHGGNAGYDPGYGYAYGGGGGGGHFPAIVQANAVTGLTPGSNITVTVGAGGTGGAGGNPGSVGVGMTLGTAGTAGENGTNGIVEIYW